MYVFQADVYCDRCGDAIRMDLEAQGRGWTPLSDSDSYPSGPHDTGEADCPDHCGGCGVFLENPLTEEGEKYVVERVNEGLEEGELSYPLDDWYAYYDLDYANYGNCYCCGNWGA